MSEDIAIQVKSVSKNFALPHEKNTTVKSLFTGITSRKSRSTTEIQHALKDVSFEVKKGEFFGIVGRNGSGKSTLLKMLAGIYQPTKGKINVQGKLVPFIELGVGFNPELTGRENVYLNGALLGFSRNEIDQMYEEIVEFAELEKFMDQKLKNYSSGMQVRLAFSMAVRAEADILLVDEVLAVGDADFQRKCFEYFKLLKKNKKTVVFVSHDMSAVREYCDKAILIEKSEIIAKGTASKIAAKYSQLFLKEDNTTQESDSTSSEERWGTHEAKYNNVTATLDKDHLHITATISSKINTDNHILYGVHITTASGQEVVATNNRMILSEDIPGLSAGEEVKVQWKILNVFNDGQFYVTVTLTDSVSTIFDWFYDAASFQVRRVERSTTPILPPISTTFTGRDIKKD